jgi:hypothetical protein
MRLIILSIFCISAIYSSLIDAAEEKKVYRWVDSQGKVHYSDKKPKDKENLEASKLPVLLEYKDQKTPQQNKRNSSKKNTGYHSLRIYAPKQVIKRSLQQANEPLSIATSISPSLRPGDVIRITLDGRVVSKSSSRSVSIAKIEFGKHRVDAAVLNKRGRVLKRAKSMMFEIQLSDDSKALNLSEDSKT